MLNLSIQWKKSLKKQSQHKFFLFFNNVLGVLTLIIGKQILILKCKTKVISHLEWFLPIWPWFDLRRSLKVKYKYPKSKAIQWWWYSSIVMKCLRWTVSEIWAYLWLQYANIFGPKKTESKISVDQIFICCHVLTGITEKLIQKLLSKIA